jgi:hypothetical protein
MAKLTKKSAPYFRKITLKKYDNFWRFNGGYVLLHLLGFDWKDGTLPSFDR